jgi:hypothetical protein
MPQQPKRSSDQILAELNSNPLTAWILEVIKPNQMFIPKAVWSLLNINKDIVYRHIVPYEGVSGRRNARGTYRSSIKIPGIVVLTWYYDSQLNQRAA